MLKAIVLDFDGVIVDTESEWYYIYRDWLKETYHYDLKIKDYLVCVGANSEALFTFLKKEIGDQVDYHGFEQRATSEFIRRTCQLPPMKGVLKFIHQAKTRNLKLAIATSATRKKPMSHLERLGILDYFEAFSTAELSEHVKPEPDIFLKAAELLNCIPEECLAVEDSGNGLLAARRAHMPCLVVPNQITKYCDFTGYYQLAESLEVVNLDEIIADFDRQDARRSKNVGAGNGK